MTALIVWRHGETEWNASRTVQGQSDVPLTEAGRAQAAAAASALAARRPTLIVSSDLQRARDTGHALAASTGVTMELDPRLRERWFGAWQGLAINQIAERFPEAHQRWQSGEPLRDTDLDDADIESVEEVAKRAGAALADAAARVAEGGTVVVATHGGAGRRGCGMLLDWPDDVVSSLAGLGNCCWTELRSGSRGWRLHAHNVGAPEPTRRS